MLTDHNVQDITNPATINELSRYVEEGTIKLLMAYFHFEDYDEFLRYLVSLGVRLLPKKDISDNQIRV